MWKFSKFQRPKVCAKINLYKSKLSLILARWLIKRRRPTVRRLSSFTTDEFASEFLLCRVCWLGAHEYESSHGRERRATSTLMKQTSFLRHTLVSREGWPMIPQQWPATSSPSVPFINGKKVGAPRVNGSLCWWLKRLAYLITANPRSAFHPNWERGVGKKRRDTQVRRRPWMLYKAA